MKHPNPSWLKRTSMAAIVAGLLVAVLGLVANPATASTADGTPDVYTKNKTCQNFGYDYGFKLTPEGIPVAGDYVVPASDDLPTGATITISNVESPDGRVEFDWSSDVAWSAVMVKQADGGLIYQYDPAVTSDTNVQTTVNNSGGISHVNFCGPGAGDAECEPGQTGTFPDCEDPECEEGQIGTYPDCEDPECEEGQIGTYPDCEDPECEEGQTGTYPDCEDPECEEGQTGTYPDCEDPECEEGQTGTYPDCEDPDPEPEAVLGASIACGAQGLTVTVTNTGDAAGTVDVLSGDTIVADNLAVAAKGSAQVAVPVAEDAAYSIKVQGVKDFAGTRDCEEVLPNVIPKTPDTPVTPDVQPAQVAGVQVTRAAAQELPRTGTTTLPLIQLGLGLMLIGAGALIIGKDQTAAI